MGEWSETLSNKLQAWQGSPSVLLDVGAYEGDFTREMLRTGKFGRAFLFECNPANAAGLREKFAAEQPVEIVPLAVGSTVGQRTFYCNADRATGSVLPYAVGDDGARNQGVREWHVEQTTLDGFAAARLQNQRVGLIKIDTQGNDLAVIQGAQEVIRTHRPWIVVELIYVPLYEGQGTPAAIFSALAALGYTMGMQVHEHYCAEGWLAFADGVFVPNEVQQKFTATFSPRPETGSLEQEVAMLRQVCDERLALIERIHTEAAELRRKIS